MDSHQFNELLGLGESHKLEITSVPSSYHLVLTNQPDRQALRDREWGLQVNAAVGLVNLLASARWAISPPGRIRLRIKFMALDEAIADYYLPWDRVH